jgi:hypothetical protein
MSTNQTFSPVAERAPQHHVTSYTVDRSGMEGPTAIMPQTEERRNLLDLITGRRRKKNAARCTTCNHQETQASIDCMPAATATAEVIEDTSASSSSTRFTDQLDQLNSCKALYNGPVNEAGEAEGQGQLVWTNGDRYVGAFFNGKQHGHGGLYFHNGAEYIGNWECGHMHGQGNHRLHNGDVFIGNFENGQRSGHGSMTFANGDRYVGSWRDGRMDGLGRYYYVNGQRFEGNFQSGKRHGQGKHQFADGSLLVHKYAQDERVGEGVLWSADRERVWRMVGATRKGRINLQQANLIMLRCEEM